MKVFVVYVSAGAGHFKAAEAVYNCLKIYHKDIESKLVDALEKSNILFKKIYTYGYTFIATYLRPLWAIGFWLTYIKFLRLPVRGLRFIINRINTKDFAKFLVQENPDFIISTHFLSSEISSYLKRTHKINSKVITTITDFGIHPFWLSDGTDIYIAASGLTRQQLIREGVDENRAKDWGIPTDLKFLKKHEEDILCRKFNLDKNKFTILIATGSFGIGPIEEIVDLLYKDVQILAVCAKNRGLYKRLKNKNYPDVRVFGLVDNIEELMAVSDIIITKPGGLTISECLAMDLPPVFISAIPGQETENLKILAHYGVGIYPANIAEIKNIVIDFKERPDKLKKIKERISKIKKPTATRELCDAVCQSSFGLAG